MREYETYKAVYCSLCRELGHTFGPFARLTLNFDFTFLAVLRLSLEPTCAGFQKRRCAFNPLVKCNTCTERTQSVSYASAIAMIMLFYKLRDNLADCSWYRRIPYYFAYPFFALARRKAAKREPEMDQLMATAMQEQSQLEKEHCDSLDQAAQPTAQALGSIFSNGIEQESDARILERMGYCIGKWIYLVDALDDMEDDLHTQSYNPILCHFHLTQSSSAEDTAAAKEQVLSLCNVCICEAIAAYELLDCKRFSEILQNILYLGLPNVQENILKKGNSA